MLPRMLSFILVPLYTRVMPPGAYGEVTLIFAWFAIFNVILSYGMETAFFRFYNKEEQKKEVVSTALISLMTSTALFVLLGFLLSDQLVSFLNIDPEYFNYFIFILGLDALSIVPFAWLRANEKPMKYAVVKIINVMINLGLNVFFLLLLPKLARGETSVFDSLYVPDYEISYIFISNQVASAVTLLIMSRLYFRRPYIFNKQMFYSMMRYGLPVMIAGIAFTINEVFDRI
ncbi:lipopolysaccharide biosynthesis protein, partial [Zeaxanthinibacter enoshimensis]|uniref:lipopolysaccharide biosynthesis protein n=1 Tax=Zeaxanthinibacter enoshimensis TaxID=392009 RepID=UPI00356193FB